MAIVRVLLDECVPRPLGREFGNVSVSTVPGQGWASRRNGDLLRLMLDAGFTVFITTDRNLAYQQNIATAGVAVIVLRARTNRLDDLRLLVPQVRALILLVAPGSCTEVAN